ncbi:hypothetical protein A7982_13110 [Minicystis rosea]|nr:hypothetical protein A7982_13110 [Minicystis rosea]
MLALITLLDHLFQLGGRLVAAAQERRPELDLTPLPTLDDMDAARSDAVRRIDEAPTLRTGDVPAGKR